MSLDRFVQNFTWYDIALIKISTLAFGFLLVKFWPALTSLPWYWYLAVVVVAAIRPAMATFGK